MAVGAMDDSNLSGIAPIPDRGGGPIMASGFWGSMESPEIPTPDRTAESPVVANAAERARRGVSTVLVRLRWRLALPALAFVCGLYGLLMGVGVTERPGITDASIVAKIYYTLGLFIFGGMDLGVPTGGSIFARGMLWTAYFLAPAITASAVIEATLRLIAPEHRWMRRLRGHVVVAGAGRLTSLYLSRLRASEGDAQIVMVTPPDAPPIELPPQMRVRTVRGDIRSDALLEMLHIDRARRVLLLTDDDFTNLDAAQKIISRAPGLANDVIVHVSDLRFLRSMAGTRLARRCTTFNGHQIAAEHMVQGHVLAHFQRTEPRDLVILAGFGRFGETILAELQQRAAGCFGHVIIIDVEAERRAMVFDEQIGFGDYERKIINGDLRDPALWHSLADEIDKVGGEPVFVLGSGVDRTNLRTALWLAGKYPKALVVARSEARWSFAEEVSRESGIATFSVAELVADSLPQAWFEVRDR